MPVNSESGTYALIVSLNAKTAYKFSVADTYAGLTAIPGAGTTLTLPGGGQSGDSYTFMDEDGTCSPANLIKVAAPAGQTIQGLGTVSFNAPFSSASFVFNQTTKRWSIISSSSGSAGGAGSPFVSVTEFGAVGDNVHDDSAAFQTAITSLAGTGISLWVPPPSVKWNIPTAPVWPAGSPVQIWAPMALATWWNGAGAISVENQTFSYAQAPGTPAYNPGWYGQSSIFWDPGNSSGVAADTNAGTTSGAPLLTFAEIVRRYGSTRPVLKWTQSVTINVISSQPANQDPVFFEPQLSGGGVLGWIGTLTQVAAFQLTVVTAKNRATGQSLRSTGFVAGGLAVGQFVVNADHPSCAWIQALAAGTATLSQPVLRQNIANAVNFTTAGPAEVDTWANGDHVTVFSLPTINMKTHRPNGGDTTNVTLVGGATWLQGLHIVDGSGAAFNSDWYVGGQDVVPWIVECSVDPFLILDANGTGGQGYFSNSYAGTTGVELISSTMLAGVAQSLFIDGNFPVVDGDAMIGSGGANIVSTEGILGLVNVLSGGTLDVSSNTLFEATFYANYFLWGLGTLNVRNGGRLANDGGTAWATVLLISTIQLDAAAAGTIYTTGPSAGTAHPDTFVVDKPGDQSVNNSTVLVNETSATPMTVSMQASDTWVIHWTLFVAYVTGANGGIQVAVTTPTGATLDVMAYGTSIASGAASVANAQNTTSSGTGVNVLNFAGNGTTAVVEVVATVVGDGTHAGTVQLQFAQTTANGTNTTIKAGSGMRALRRTRQYVDAVLLTAAALDSANANGGMQNPVTGSRYCKAA